MPRRKPSTAVAYTVRIWHGLYALPCASGTVSTARAKRASRAYAILGMARDVRCVGGIERTRTKPRGHTMSVALEIERARNCNCAMARSESLAALVVAYDRLLAARAANRAYLDKIQHTADRLIRIIGVCLLHGDDVADQALHGEEV